MCCKRKIICLLKLTTLKSGKLLFAVKSTLSQHSYIMMTILLFMTWLEMTWSLKWFERFWKYGMIGWWLKIPDITCLLAQLIWLIWLFWNVLLCPIILVGSYYMASTLTFIELLIVLCICSLFTFCNLLWFCLLCLIRNIASCILSHQFHLLVLGFLSC